MFEHLSKNPSNEKISDLLRAALAFYVRDEHDLCADTLARTIKLVNKAKSNAA